MTDYRTPEDLRAAAWAMMSRGVADRRHPARHPTLATIGAHGPEARTVVLRGWSDGIAEIHTDRASSKVAALAADPRAALHVWVPRARLQIRLLAQVDMVHGDADRWARVPDKSRLAYGGTPPPGKPIAAPREHDPDPLQDRFTVLHCRCHAADILHLGTDLHRRVRFDWTGDRWAGTWIAP